MIQCGRCGNTNAGDVLFCQFCGTRLVAERLPEPAVVERAPVGSNRATDRLVEGSVPNQLRGPSPMGMPLGAA